MTPYEDFARAYLEAVSTAVNHMIPRSLEAIGLLKTAARSGTHIRAFGNGGSSAIVRSALLQLHAHTELPVNDAMMSPATMAYSAQRQGYRTVFAQALARDIHQVGLVVVASVSGRSTNIVEASRLCSARRVPLLALVGGDGTQMEPVNGMIWPTGTTDQQVSEDATLTALTLATAAALDPHDAPLPTSQEHHLQALASVDVPPLAGFLHEATEAIVDAIRNRRHIYVLCPDGGPLALTAEHFAHNLSWDAPLGVEGVQPPVVISDPSLADLSAICNDHPDPAHGVRYRLSSASPDDVVFLLAYDSKSPTTQEAVKAAAAAGARIFPLHRHDSNQPADQHHFMLPRVDDFAHAALVQSVAHLLCRTTRAALSGATPRYLMAQDLAPLRELSTSQTL